MARAVRAIGIDPLALPSGAGHDTQCLAQMAPCGMLFVPSAGGISHAPDEHTDERDIEAGVRALAAAWYELAERS